MSLNYIPMSTPNVASIRKEILVNIEDPVADRSLLDPNVDGDEEAINNDNEGQKLMDPDAHDYTGADIYQASLKESAGIYQLPSDIYASKDKTDLSAGNSNPSLFDDEGSTKQSDILDPDVSNYDTLIIHQKKYMVHWCMIKMMFILLILMNIIMNQQ